MTAPLSPTSSVTGEEQPLLMGMWVYPSAGLLPQLEEH